MKKILLLTTTLLVTTSAFADAPYPSAVRKNIVREQLMGPYTKFEAGISIPNKTKLSGTGTGVNSTVSLKHNPGLAVGLGGGYRFNEFFRSDLMVRYAESRSKTQNIDVNKDGNANATKVRVQSFSAMLNGYLDAQNETIFTPYALIGVGIGRNNSKLTLDGFSVKPKETNFIWNVGAGVSAKMNNQVSLGLEYRYADLGKLGNKSTTMTGVNGLVNLKAKRFTTHQIMLNLIYGL